MPQSSQHTPAPEQAPSAIIPTPAEPNHSPESPKRRIGIWVLVALLVAGIFAALAFLFWPASCFDTSAYKPLLSVAEQFEGNEGIDEYDVVQNESLFMQSIYFNDSSIEVNTELSDNPEGFYAKLADYYRRHNDTAPVKLVVQSSYQAGTFSDIAKQRVTAVKQKLLAAGVAASAITAEEPIAIAADDDLQYEDDFEDGLPVGVSVVPVSRCETN